MNVERLLKLADLLEKDAVNETGMRFNICHLGFWAGMDKGEKIAKLDCGTTGCAMGLAAMSGEFRDEGLSYTTEAQDAGIQILIEGRHMSYDTAAAKFFDISFNTSWDLFSPGRYAPHLLMGGIGELEVARRIRHLVANGNIHIDSMGCLA